MVNHPNRSKRQREAMPACFQHPLLNSPWSERHMLALTYLAGREYASVREIGRAAGGGLRTDGEPLDALGAGKHGGRIVNDLHRLGFAAYAQPYRDARGYHQATREGRAVVTKGPLRYAVEREA